MPHSNDMVDALMGAFATGRRVTFQRGRNVGKTALAQQLKDMHDYAWSPMPSMKSNPNPYRPTTATGLTIRRSDLDTIVRSQILPDCITNFIDTSAFDSWTWGGLVNGMSKAIGIVSARHIPTNTYCQHKFYLIRGLVDDAMNSSQPFKLDCLLEAIKRGIQQAVCDIVASVVPPHDINTCTDPECYC